jgi:hypothetical protein
MPIVDRLPPSSSPPYCLLFQHLIYPLHTTLATMSDSEWSIEAIIALVALVTACVPAVPYIWHLVKRYKRSQHHGHRPRQQRDPAETSSHRDMFGAVDEELGCIAPPYAAPRDGPGRGGFGAPREGVWGECAVCCDWLNVWVC